MGLIWSLLRTPYLHWAHLPYNLNWGGTTRGLREFLEQNPVTVCDIGARGGRIPELTPLLPNIRYYGFDADQEECAHINQNPPGHFASYTCVPRCIGDGKPATFWLYRERSWSSVFPLSQQFQADILPPMPLDRQVVLPTITLDEALAACPEPMDFLKLDTQGSELDILNHAPRTLGDSFLVEIEVEFLPIYQGQPTFDAIHRFMLDQGFELLYLNRVFGQKSRIYKGPARGQVMWGDALYGRSLKTLAAPPERLAKYAILLANYGHLDWAYEIYSRVDAVRTVCPALGRTFRKRHGKLRKLKRVLVGQFEKLLCLCLRIRRYNQLRWESDRSWPIR